MLLLIHTAATLLLAGLIWTIQVVHYPLMARVGEASFAAYHAAHSRRISLVVVPLMMTELISGAWLLIDSQPPFAFGPALAGMTLIGVAWGSTFFLQVPQHRILMAGFDGAAHRRLVATNWIRTVAWTARSGLLGAVMTAA